MRDGVAGGLVARHGQHQHEVAELIVGQPVPVDLRADQLGDDVVPGAAAPLLGHGHAVAEDLDGGHLARVLLAWQLVVVADHPVGPGEDLAPVLLRDADQVADGLQRQLARHVGDEVPGAGVQRGGHDALGAFGQDLAQVADGPGGEAAGDDAAHPGVLRGVHVEQDDPLHLDGLAGDALLEPDQRGVLLRGVHVGGLGHRQDVGVPGDRPVPLVVEAGRAAALGDPPDRGGAAQFGQLLGRHPGGVDLGIGKVEARRDVRNGHGCLLG